MRRFIFSLLIISLTVSLTFATSKPSLDGRAVVAEEGVLPVGLFAKTVGYLPGDSVSVTNPSTGITINVLILGSIDPSAGVAILLSPEAADKLFITPDSNTQVKITKRTGMLDEAGSGTGTLVSDTPSDTLLPNQVKNDLDSKLSSLDETLGTASTTEDMAQDTTETSLPETTEEAEALAVTIPEDSQLIPEEEIVIPEEISPLPTETTVPAPEDEVSDYAVTAVEEIPLNHVLAEHDPVYIVESLSEDPFTGFENEPDLAEVTTEEESAEEITEADVSEEAEEIVLVPVDPEMEDSEEWPYTEDTSLADEYLAADDSSLVDPFAPIILVPADENPPEDTTPIEEAASTFVPVPVESNVAKNLTPSPSSTTTNQKGIVKSLSELESGKYYVQVATFVEQENIDRLLKEYGSKYPFVMVPLKSGKAMQMMVGPLNVDEYGAVLARFKNLGFKDSFLRKIR